MSRCNALAEQMGVGADDDRHDPYDNAETPEPCRGCGRTDCGEQCAEFRAWLTVAWLAVDAAVRGGAA